MQDQRMVLYGLYVLVKLHFHEEEVAYLPLLDQKLTPEAAGGMFEAMEAAAARAKRATPAAQSPAITAEARMGARGTQRARGT